MLTINSKLWVGANNMDPERLGSCVAHCRAFFLSSSDFRAKRGKRGPQRRERGPKLTLTDSQLTQLTAPYFESAETISGLAVPQFLVWARFWGDNKWTRCVPKSDPRPTPTNPTDPPIDSNRQPTKSSWEVDLSWLINLGLWGPLTHS